MQARMKEPGLLIYGVILSSIIGLISFIFLQLESRGSEFLWELVPSDSSRFIYVFIITVIGGVLVGMCRKRWGDVPATAHTSMETLKEAQTLNYYHVYRSLITALIVLIFGAGVGPEAGLLGAVVYFSVWQADKLRYYYFNYQELQQLPIGERFKRLANPFNYLETYEHIRATKENKAKKKKILYGLFIVNGLLAFFFLMKLTKQPSFITKMGQSDWAWGELWLVLPLMLFGVIYGLGYHLMTRMVKKTLNFWQEFPIRKALLGSMAIFLIGIFLPNLLFSGQVSLSLVPLVGVEQSFLVLSLLAMIKLLFLQVCFNTGWVGGDIFPVAFSAIIQGFAVAQLFPEYDRLLIVCVVSTSIAITIIKSPILVGLFIALFFPLNLFPLILIIALILLGIKKRIPTNFEKVI